MPRLTYWVVEPADRALLRGPGDRLVIPATSPESARARVAAELGCDAEEIAAYACPADLLARHLGVDVVRGPPSANA